MLFITNYIQYAGRISNFSMSSNIGQSNNTTYPRHIVDPMNIRQRLEHDHLKLFRDRHHNFQLHIFQSKLCL